MTGGSLFFASVASLVALGPIDRVLPDSWIRGDVSAAMAEAQRRGVPVMAVLRCVP